MVRFVGVGRYAVRGNRLRCLLPSIRRLLETCAQSLSAPISTELHMRNSRHSLILTVSYHIPCCFLHVLKDEREGRDRTLPTKTENGMLVCQVSFGSRPVFVKLLAVGGASPSWVTLSLFCSQAPTKTVEVEAPTKTVEVDGRTVRNVEGWSQALRGHSAACTKTFFTGQPGKCFLKTPISRRTSPVLKCVSPPRRAKSSILQPPGSQRWALGFGFAAASVIRAVSAT